MCVYEKICGYWLSKGGWLQTSNGRYNCDFFWILKARSDIKWRICSDTWIKNADGTSLEEYKVMKKGLFNAITSMGIYALKMAKPRNYRGVLQGSLTNARSYVKKDSRRNLQKDSSLRSRSRWHSCKSSSTRIHFWSSKCCHYSSTIQSFRTLWFRSPRLKRRRGVVRKWVSS